MKKMIFGVIGNPVEHSKSPLIHQQFAQQFGIDLRYEKIFSEVSEFNNTVTAFQQNGGAGLNVTVPFKTKACQLANALGEAAKIACAANTLTFHKDGAIQGDNTDGIGLLRDLEINLQFMVGNKAILILGAGGATRGILEPLLHARPKQLVLCNRTIEKAQQMAEDFSSYGKITVSSYAQLAGRQFDLIINATSASLSGETLPLPDNLAGNNSLAYDLAYSPGATPFMQWAKAQRATTIADGLGMLVEQAAESFYIWHHQRPNTQPVLTALRQEGMD